MLFLPISVFFFLLFLYKILFYADTWQVKMPLFVALVEYKNMSKKTLQESIKSEMSGNLQELLVAVGKKTPDFPSDTALVQGCTF